MKIEDDAPDDQPEFKDKSLSYNTITPTSCEADLETPEIYAKNNELTVEMPAEKSVNKVSDDVEQDDVEQDDSAHVRDSAAIQKEDYPLA